MNFQFSDFFKELDVDYDGCLIFDSRLRLYFTGFCSTDGVLFFNKTEAFLFVDFRYFEMAKQSAKNCNVVNYNNFEHEFRKITGLKKEAKVVVASKGLFAKTFVKLKNMFEDLNFDLNDKFDEKIAMKMAVKTHEEICKIISAQKIVDWTFSEILNYIKPGISEIEIARKINSKILSKADGLAFETIVVSGKRTSLPHGHATEKLLCEGDFITMDFGAVVEGFCSDMTRTVGLGRVLTNQKKIYDLVLNAQKIAIDLIGEGTNCCEVDLSVRNYFKEYDYEKAFGHSLGHGVGMWVHEQPNLSPRSEQKFKQGHVVTVEPGLYFPDEFGVRIEDLIVVEADGVVNLTKSDKNLICL